MRLLMTIIASIAVLLALAIFAAGPGTRFGLWDYGTGLTIIREVSAPKKIADGISLSPLFTVGGLALLGAIVAAVMKQGRAARLGAIGFIAAALAAAPPIMMKSAFEKNPFIHEVTTDFDNPPAIVAAADLPRKNPAEYEGAVALPQATDGTTNEEAQKKAFPDIAPVVVASELQSAAAVARDIVEAMGMRVLAEGPADSDAGGGWRIEAVATSTWFGFKDDFIVRLTPEEGKTRVDLRSKSRVGGSDLGANAKRVRTFMKRFDAAI